MDDPGSRTPGRGFSLLSLLLAGCGLALAAYRLGAQSFWLDETYTWWFTRLGLSDLLQATRMDAVNPPLYYIYVKLLAPAGSEIGLRLPSVLAQLAGIAGAIVLGLVLGGRAGGLAAGLIWAAHPLTLWAARDARPYALSAALAVIAVALFVQLQRSWTTAFAALAWLVLAAGLLTHYFFFVLVAALVVLAAVDLRSHPAFFRRWTVVVLLAMIPLAIWLGWFFSSGTASLGIGWIRRPAVGDVPLTMWNLASGYGGQTDFASTFFGVILLLVLSAGLTSSARGRWLRIALAGILAPLLAVWLVSQRRPVYVDRYFVVLLPFVAALVALGASAFVEGIRDWAPPRRRAAHAAGFSLLAIAALVAALTVHRATKFDKEDWRGLAAFLHGREVEADALSLSEPEIALPLSYYFQRSFLTQAPALVPACGTACWWILRQPYTATHALTQSVREAGRENPPSVPDGCRAVDLWLSPTGIAAWQLVCPG